MITICLTYFKSLALANLQAALYSVGKQDLSLVESMIVVDNDTEDSADDIMKSIDMLSFPMPVRLLSFKHGDPSKTHSWSTNVAVRETTTPWVLFTRADYLLDFGLMQKFTDVADPWSFVTSNGCHLAVDVHACERTTWRSDGLREFRRLPGTEFDYTNIDAGVWMTMRQSFDKVGGLDESLTAWGHAQTHFQWKLHKSGIRFTRIPEVMFYHPHHSAPRDIELAHAQLREHGVDLKEMWARYEGAQPYA